MAVRVRKLARELNRGPNEVIGLLHAIGLDKYRTADDMLPDPAADAVRKAIRDGVQPLPVQVPESHASNRATDADDEDLMGRLVPGVTRAGRVEKPRGRTAPAVATAPPPAAPIKPAPGGRVAEAERAAVFAERAAVEAERTAVRRDAETLAEREAAIAAERERLAAEWSLLAEERVNLARERAAVAKEREDVARERANASPRAVATGATLADLLAARGLKGLDECERAVGALASARLLGDLLLRLRTDEPELVERFLRERLVLVAGEAPTGIGAAAVTVSPDRAEVPDSAGANKAIARLGEALLLAGLRRVLIVGGRPGWQKLLRAQLDARLDVRFLPPAPRGRAEAESDVMRTDVVVLWSVPADAAARDVYAQSRAVVVHVDHDTLPALVAAVTSGISA